MQFRTNSESGSAILPKGDRYELPEGRKKFSLRSLFGLLAAGAVVAGVCKWLALDPMWTIVLEMYVILVWWHIAELRAHRAPAQCADQSSLREEVRRWLKQREQQE